MFRAIPRGDIGQLYPMPAGRALGAVLCAVLLAACAQTALADPPVESEVSSHIVIGMTPSQGFEVTCEDSVLFMDPVVADELGIIEFQIEGRFGASSNTVCVRVPAPPAVLDEYVTDVSDLTATVCWSTDRPATSQVEYGKTQSYGMATPEDSALTVEHALGLSELSPETTYHYRVVSCDAFGNRTVGSDRTFMTMPPAPTLDGIHVEALTDSAFVAAWATDRPCRSSVEYGLSDGYGMATPLTPAFTTEHEVLVDGLEPLTEYHYRVVSTDEMGGTVRSEDRTVTTEQAALLMSGLTVESTTATTATITWSTTNRSTSWVVYGETSDYGEAAGCDSLVAEHTVVLEALEPGTEYRFLAFSVDQSGASVESGEFQFTTGCAPLEMDGPHVAGTTGTTIVLSWTTSAPADGRVEYGADENYGQVAYGDTALGLGHQVTLSGLEPATLYHMRAVSSDADGCTEWSDDLTASTDPPELNISSPAVSETTATSATVDWNTSTPSQCYVEYGTTQAYGFETEQSPFHLAEHSAVLTDLAPRTVYHFRVWATDYYGQTAVSSDATFITKDQDGPCGLLVYGVVARQISPTHALICWQTNTAATSIVHYGTTEDCHLALQDDELVTNHCLTLTGLSPGTRYYYRVASEAGGSLAAESQTYSFSTPLNDNLPPGAPAAVQATSCYGGVSVSWDTGLEYDLASYRIHRRSSGASSFTVVAEVPSSDTYYVDRDVAEGWSYEYALSALDTTGNESSLSQAVSATAGIEEGGHVWVYPNPVTNKRTTISFSAPGSSGERYSISIYDARGRLIRSLPGGAATDRASSIIWDTRDSMGAPVSSGIYFCVVSLPGDALRSKIMVIR